MDNTELNTNENNFDSGFSVEKSVEKRTLKTGFSKFDKRTKVAQNFDKEKIQIKRGGKKINLYEFIQENGVDCAINDVINKYGTGVGINKIQKTPEEIIADFSDYNDLMTFKNRELKANEMFNSLPVNIKQQFNNSKQEFMDKGLKWAENLVSKAKTKAEQANAALASTTETTTATEVNNG